MKKTTQILLKLPEYVLVLAVLFYWASAGILINPIAIGLMALLVFQIIYKNQILGLIIPSLLIIICLYMLLALISEFNEFPTFNADAKKLLFVGLLFFISTMTVSVIMVYNYSKTEKLN
ncbi:MAG: hypothetical protein DA407_13245 [Bacteroidetes bacterium]|nr:MAG: hypothetical protein DA407_13245 [Bacteroidota bacterium]